MMINDLWGIINSHSIPQAFLRKDDIIAHANFLIRIENVDTNQNKITQVDFECLKDCLWQYPLGHHSISINNCAGWAKALLSPTQCLWRTGVVESQVINPKNTKLIYGTVAELVPNFANHLQWEDEQIPPTIKNISNGLNCSKCNDFYPYAEANQPNGSLICWSCRFYG